MPILETVLYSLHLVEFGVQPLTVCLSVCLSVLPLLIQLWDATTGDNEMTVKGHSSTILGCSINETGDLLITCSLDCTCAVSVCVCVCVCVCLFMVHIYKYILIHISYTCTQVWMVDTVPAKQLVKFTGHQRAVKCCALSPDSKLVVSGDFGSSVMVCSTCHRPRNGFVNGCGQW